MEIRMLKTATTLGYREESYKDKNGDLNWYANRTYDIEFIVRADETTKLIQIDDMLTSFIQLKEIPNEMYVDKRMTVQDNSTKKGIFTVKICLADDICYDEFMCKTDDFKTFNWYARNITIEEKAENFKPIK